MRDLEIALVLAREMKAAAARSVDASLRLDQLQEVFGVDRLDDAERARIQTALQMAGLEPHPSLLEADPAAPIRFGAAVPAAATAGGTNAAPPEPAPAEPKPTFPTVGQFARSKLGRTRGFGARRGDHGPDRTAPLPEDDPPALPGGEHAGPLAEEDPHLEAEHEDGIDEQEHAVDEHEHEHRVGDPELADEAHEHGIEEHEPVAEEHLHGIDEPEHGPEHAEHDEPEYVPLTAAEYPAPPVGYDAYAAAAAQEPHAAAPAPERTGARTEDVVAALVPAVALPVIVTSIAGWRFGLPFVALTVVATGILLGRRSRTAGAPAGLLAAFRASPAAATVLKATVAVTLLSAGAAVVLATAGGDSAPKDTGSAPAEPAKSEPPSTTAKPATPPQPEAAQPAEPSKPKAKHRKKDQQPAEPAQEEPVDPSTQGLVRVPPKSSGEGGTGAQDGTGAQPGTTTQPGTTP